MRANPHSQDALSFITDSHLYFSCFRLAFVTVKVSSKTEAEVIGEVNLQN
jgi:hypothetical protein